MMMSYAKKLTGFGFVLIVAAILICLGIATPMLMAGVTVDPPPPTVNPPTVDPLVSFVSSLVAVILAGFALFRKKK